MKALQLKGRIFGRLTVTKPVDEGKSLKWLCKCDCGKSKIVRGADLNRGFIKSCGCGVTEMLVKRNTTHNLASTRFYRIWQAMKDRCINPKSSRYEYYGGRGIKVYKRWLVFESFRDDMYKTYLLHVKKFGEKNTSIDRIDNNKSYILNNCRWATQKEQINNRRKVLNVKHG